MNYITMFLALQKKSLLQLNVIIMNYVIKYAR